MCTDVHRVKVVWHILVVPLPLFEALSCPCRSARRWWGNTQTEYSPYHIPGPGTGQTNNPNLLVTKVTLNHTTNGGSRKSTLEGRPCSILPKWFRYGSFAISDGTPPPRSPHQPLVVRNIYQSNYRALRMMGTGLGLEVGKGCGVSAGFLWRGQWVGGDVFTLVAGSSRVTGSHLVGRVTLPGWEWLAGGGGLCRCKIREGLLGHVCCHIAGGDPRVMLPPSRILANEEELWQLLTTADCNPAPTPLIQCVQSRLHLIG